MRTSLIVAGGLVLAAAQRPTAFSFDPQPRWPAEPETEAVCEAIAKECPGFLKDGSIDTAWGYAEIYNADGYLVGLKSTRSTGCRPLDEQMLLGHRHFATVFTKEGPDLENLAIETAPGVDRGGVTLVKRGETSVSFGC